MRKAHFGAALVASFALALPAAAFAANPVSNKASNIGSSTITSPIAPQLPTADVGPNATVGQYLSAAANALSARQTGLAQSSLENAETLALTRSVPYTTTGNVLDSSPLVKNINAALQALGQGDIAGAQHFTSLASQGAS